MGPRRHSRTAEATAAIRASHLLHDRPHVFVDPYALQLTSATWRLVCRNGLLHRLVVRGLLAGLRPVHGWILVRDQFTEECLRRFVAAGPAQYLLLGAGFDSTALRRPSWLGGTPIIEVDHPATQAVKLARMRGIGGGALPRDFEALPVDFEHERLATALRRSGHRPALRTFVAWQGVVYYLTDAAIRETLADLAQQVPAGSELLFDHLLPERLVAADAGHALSLARLVTARMGERYISYHTPAQVAALLDEAGFEVVAHHDDRALEASYLGDRGDDLSAMRGFGIVHARRRGP